ncbi:biotin--[acetyl-CoA-carboxylase] ligase [Calderihabitans maritimus]|uniref:Bifunctional ligase/repressor BirA n=1 Tax=Calderihabitans maritimus TaxID=1246530 RepID=A0A1Z5HSF2_9FIRM|nr:biotin--[acetyl-CoA-carboxylase] ligase [Calderihabitans maritimus]GAW92210.1 biotin-(acetyl-CoA carboxylase) ligase [Calderihabitans maritimus]
MKEAVLEILRHHRGTFISGQELSERLGITRTAVWKHIKTLQQEGYRIEAQPRRGYCLQEVPDFLYPEELRAGLSTSCIGRNIVHYHEVGSTNTVAKQLAERGEREGTVVIAEKQTEGRGRLGRRWESPYGKGIWLSIILRPRVATDAAPSITLLAAVAVAKAIKNFCGLEALIKWPNDILVRGKKVCGILTEMKADMDVVEYVVVGIGLNANLEVQDFPEEIRDKATSLRILLNKKISRVNLVRKLFGEFESLYNLFREHGFSPIRSMWKEMNTTLGQQVQVNTLTSVYSGLAVDITEDGGLVVETKEGTKVFYGGEVSLRKHLN